MRSVEPLPASGSVREAIRAARAWLSPSMARIADVVLSDPDGAARLTSSEIAVRAGVSQATVTRFCAAIGVDSFQDLVHRLARESGREDAGTWSEIELSVDIDLAGDTKDTALSVAAAAIRGIRLSAEHLDTDRLVKAADCVAKARRVDVYGAGGSGSVAQETEQRMFRIGVPIRSWNDIHGAGTSAALLGPDDVAIAISDSGTTKETHEALRLAQRAGATGIAITCDPRSPIAEIADIPLVAFFGADDSMRTRTLASRHAQLFIVDCLYVLVAQLTERRVRLSAERTGIINELHTIAPRASRRR